jgi:hypothetical protein
MSKQAQICPNFVRRRAKRCQWRENIDVDLARVRLRRDWVRVRELRHFCYQSIEFLYLFIAGIIRRKGDITQSLTHLVMVTIKQREKARLCSCGAFNTAETQIVPRPLNVAEVPEQFLASGKR